jgi:hypothetical protein
MIDDQVNEEEIAESRKQRQAAADDGMPAEPEKKAAPAAVQIQYRTPKHWVKNAKMWLSAGGRTPS